MSDDTNNTVRWVAGFLTTIVVVFILARCDADQEIAREATRQKCLAMPDCQIKRVPVVTRADTKHIEEFIRK